MKRWLASLALWGGLVLGGCTSPAAPVPPTPPTNPTAPDGGSGAAAAAPPAPARVRIGWRTPAVSDAAILLADDRGYFQELGLQIEYVPVNTTPAMMAPLAQGQLEVATGGLNAALWNAVANDVPIKIVADKGSMTQPFQTFMVRQDLVDQLHDWADLRGRRIAINGTGTSDHLALLKALARGGLTEHDVDVTTMPWPDMGPAFSNRAIDVGISLEPLQTRFAAEGIAQKWRGLDELSPNQQTAAIFYGPRFAATDAATRFMVAYLRGARDYNDAFGKGIGREEVIAVFLKHIPGVERALYDQMALPGINPNGRVNVASIEEDMRAYVATGTVRQPVDVAKVVDHRFADAAVQLLGEYQ
jgi:ABC-type nitrate/sulfonate/bicarbonate transport system substrate-binding protein